MWRGIAIVAACVAALFTGMVAWLGSPGGKHWLQASLNHYLAPNIRIGDIQTLTPQAVQLKQLQFTDAHGPWLVVKDISLAWQPAALLRGQIHVDALTATTADLLRIPVQKAAKPSPPFNPAMLFDLPVLHVGKLAIAQLKVAPAVYGQAADFSLNAQADIYPQMPLNSTLALQLTEADTPNSHAEITFAPENGKTLTRLDIRQGAGLLLGQLAGLPKGQGIYARLMGTGDMSHWQGESQINAGELAALNTQMTITWGAEPEVLLDGTLTASMLPLPLGYQTRFTWRQKPYRAQFKNIHLTFGQAQASGDALYTVSSNTLDSDLQLTSSTLTLPEALCTDCHIKNMDITLQTHGPLDQLTHTISGSAGRYTQPGIDATTLVLQGMFGPKQPHASLSGTVTLTPPPTLRHMLPDGIYLKGPISVGLSKGRLHVQTNFTGPDSMHLNADIFAPFDLQNPTSFPLDSPLDGRAQGRLELASLRDALGLTSERLAGLVDFNLQLDGTLKTPGLTGRLALSNGTYEDLLYGTKLSNISADAEAKGQTISLMQFNGTDGHKGTFKGSGTATLHNLLNPDYDLNLMMHALQTVNTGWLGATTSGHLGLKGNLDGGTLSGTVTIDRAELYTTGLPTASRPFNGYKVEAVDAHGNPLPLQPKAAHTGYAVTLDNLKVQADNGLFVRGHGLNSEWGANLNIDGPEDTPTLEGNLLLKRGRLDVAGLVVDLQGGGVHFHGDPQNPDLDVQGLVRGRSMNATMQVSGNVAKPDLTLKTDNNLPQDEILAQLLFGTSVTQLSPGQALQVAQVLASLAGQGSSLNPVDALRKGFGLDMLSVSMGKENGGPSISAGKYISKRIYVGVEQGADAESSAVRAEINLTPRVNLETEVGSDNDSKVGVKWKWDY